MWGPPESFIEGNNELALALVMTIPLMRFLQLQMKAPLARHALTLTMLLSAVSALGTQSRGALLAILAMAVVLWTRTRHKLVSGIALVLVGAALIAFMPGEWEHRMSSIADYEQDASAMGRINAWWMAWNLAVDRPFGGGYDIYWPDVFARYAPVPDDVHAAHSIYFQVLGEHGFIGLGLFLLVWIMAWRTAGYLRRTGPLASGNAMDRGSRRHDAGESCRICGRRRVPEPRVLRFALQPRAARRPRATVDCRERLGARSRCGAHRRGATRAVSPPVST